MRIENEGKSKEVTFRVKTIFSMGIFFFEKHNVKIFMGKNLAPREDVGCMRIVVIFLNLFFNWRKIALQCCDGFCCTTTEISHNYTCTATLQSPPPLPASHPARSSECLAGLPVLHSNFSPATYLHRVAHTSL